MRRRSTQLVCQHLEHVSGRVLEEYPEVIRAYIRGRHGVYALFRKGKFYYVGLARDMRRRLKHHLRDRHSRKWDTFSIYLTIQDRHLHELESLVLRIAAPTGNRQKGKFLRSQDLRRELAKRIAKQQREERRRLLGLDAPLETSAGTEEHREGRTPKLASYVSGRVRLRWRFKGRRYKATIRRDGRIRFRGRLYTSPSLAAAAVTHRAMNGWTCWKYERSPGEWVALDEMRRR